MKKLILILSSIAFCCSGFAQTNIYLNKGVFDSSGSWCLDKELTTPANAYPTSAPDYNAVFYNNTSNCWLTKEISNAYNIIAVGSGLIQFGQETQQRESKTGTLYVENSLAVKVGSWSGKSLTIENAFNSSYSDGVTLNIVTGSIDVGTSIFEGITTYGSDATMFIDLAKSAKVAHSTITVKGDVNIGGGLICDTVSNLYINAHETNVLGSVNMLANGAKYSVLKFHSSTDVGVSPFELIFNVGGLQSVGNLNSEVSILNERKNDVSKIVFKNAAGTDFTYKGQISDFGLNWNNDAAGTGALNFSMEGEGIQRVHVYRNGGMNAAYMNGTITAKNGRLFWENSQIKSANNSSSLIVDGGNFGAFNTNVSQSGSAVFKNVTWNSGAFVFENHILLNELNSDKIYVKENFIKAKAGQIIVDFSNIFEGEVTNFDASGVKNEDGIAIEDMANWIELIQVAGSLEGFNIDDANADFIGVGINNASAYFKWVLDDANGKYSLKVAFGEVIPEASFYALILALLAIVFVTHKKRS